MKLLIAFLLGALCFAYPPVGLALLGVLGMFGAASLAILSIYDRSVPVEDFVDLSQPDSPLE